MTGPPADAPIRPQAVDFVHAADVVHGSLSSGSVLVSTEDDRDAEGLVVKLDSEPD